MAVQYNSTNSIDITFNPEHMMRIHINTLLKLEFDPHVVFTDEEDEIQSTDSVRKIMSVCKCDELRFHDTEHFKRFISITGIPLTDHHTWRECIATHIVNCCCHDNNKNQIDRLFPDGPYEKHHYTGCDKLFSELLVLAQLDYPRALDILDERLASIGFTIDDLI